MSEPDAAAVIAAYKAAEAAKAFKTEQLAVDAAPVAVEVLDVDPRIADLTGKGLTEAEALKLIASMW